jgi:peptidoglycan hydrolase CwlO-like protein
MAAAAVKLERIVEERVARLEAHVENIQSDVSDIKADMRQLDQKVNSLKESQSELRVSMDRSFTKLILLLLALAASLLSVMAKGFGWIT